MRAHVICKAFSVSVINSLDTLQQPWCLCEIVHVCVQYVCQVMRVPFVSKFSSVWPSSVSCEK